MGRDEAINIKKALLLMLVFGVLLTFAFQALHGVFQVPQTESAKQMKSLALKHFNQKNKKEGVRHFVQKTFYVSIVNSEQEESVMVYSTPRPTGAFYKIEKVGNKIKRSCSGGRNYLCKKGNWKKAKN